MRQQKAEEIRSQIESSRKSIFEQIREKQKVIKNRWKSILEEKKIKKIKLQDKLEQAQERRDAELQNL